MDYSECKKIPREEVPFISAPKDAIEADCRVPGFPLYESPSRDYRQMKHYSLCTNNHLRCHWKNFKEQYGYRYRIPALLPKPENVHFANCQTRFDKPSAAALDYRRHMRIGPGTDVFGPLPIPNDLHMRNTVAKTSRNLPKRDH